MTMPSGQVPPGTLYSKNVLSMRWDVSTYTTYVTFGSPSPGAWPAGKVLYIHTGSAHYLVGPLKAGGGFDGLPITILSDGRQHTPRRSGIWYSTSGYRNGQFFPAIPMHAYAADPVTPTIEIDRVYNVQRTGFDVDVSVINVTVPINLYGRFRKVGTSNWITELLTFQITPYVLTRTFHITPAFRSYTIDPGTQYEFEVSVNSNFSNAVSTSVTTLANTVISKLTVATTNTTATLTATIAEPLAVGSTVYFRRRAAGTDDWTNISARTATPDNTTVVVTETGLSESTEYDYEVSVRLDYGGGDPITKSGTFTTTGVAPAIGSPIELLIDRNEVQFTVPVTNPRAVGGATVYFRWRRQGTTAWRGTARTATIASPKVVAQVSGLTEGTTYEYQISLQPGFGDATTRTFATPTTRAALLEPKITVVHNAATITATVEHPHAVGTRIYARWREFGDTEWNNLTVQDATPDKAIRTFNITGLSESTYYEWQISLSLSYFQESVRRFTTPASTPSAPGTPPSLGTPQVSTTNNAVDIAVPVLNPVSTGTTVYSRYRRGTAGPWTPFSAASATPASPTVTFSDTGLVDNTAYQFQVSLSASYTGATNMTFTTGNLIVPTLSAPSIEVTRFTADISATVSNPKATGTTVFFRHRRSGTVDWTPTSQSATPTSATKTFTLTNLTEGTDYEYQISLSQTFADAPLLSFETDRLQPVLGTPTATTSFTTASIRVEVANPNAVGSTVYARYREKGDTDWINISAQSATPASPTRTFRVSNLDTSTIFEYQVSLASGYAGEATYTFETLTRQPVLGQSFVAVLDTSAEITVTVANPFVVGTTVYARFRQGRSGDWKNLSAQTTTPTSPTALFAATGLVAGTLYQYQVSLTLGYAGVQSQVFTTLRTADVPTLGVPTVATTTNSAAIVVTVSNPNSVGSRVYGRWREQGDTDWKNLSAQDATPAQPIRTFSITGLDAATTYEYELSLLSSLTGATTRTFETRATVLNPTIGVPVATPGTNDVSIEVSVTNPKVVGGSTVYARWRQGKSGGWEAISAQTATVAEPTRTFTVDGLTEQTLYQYQVSLSPSYTGAPEYEFTTLTAVVGPTLGEPFVTVADTSATILVTVNNPKAVGGSTVYARRRQQGEMDWENISARTALTINPQVAFSLVDLKAGTTYEYEVSLNIGYADADTKSGSFTTLNPIRPLSSAPTGFAVVWNNNVANLSWNALAGADTYSIRYQEVAPGAGITQINFIEGTSERLSGLKHATEYRFELRGVNTRGSSPEAVISSTSPAATVETTDGVYLKFDYDNDGVAEYITERMLAFEGSWGEPIEGTLLDRTPPANGQIILDNDDGFFVLNNIKINIAAEVGLRINGIERPQVAGYISDVYQDLEVLPGKKTVVVIFQGIFHRLAQEDGATAVHIRKPFDALTSEVLEQAFAANDRVPATQRDIQRGMVRISAINSPLVSTSGFIEANLIQAAHLIELAEGGTLDEGRGNMVRFSPRFQRELQSGIDGRYFSDVYSETNARIVFEDYEPVWVYDNIYHKVQGTAVQHAPVAVQTIFSETFVENAKPTISPGASYPYEADLQYNTAARTQPFITEALSWTPISPANLSFELANGTAVPSSSITIGGEPAANRITITEIEETPSIYRFKIVNRLGGAIRLNSVELSGEGIQRLTEFKTEVSNPNTITEHNVTRTLDLGLNYGGASYGGANLPATATAYLRFLLRRYSNPVNNVRLDINPYSIGPTELVEEGQFGLAAEVVSQLLPGDIINIVTRNLADEIPPGTWFVNGGTFSYQALTDRTVCGLNTSQRGRVPTILTNQLLNVTASSTSPVKAGTSFALRGGRVYVVVVEASLPSGSVVDASTWNEEDAVVEIATSTASDRFIHYSWIERDVNVGSVASMAGILTVDYDTTVQVNIKRRAGGPAVTLERFRFWQMPED